MALVEYKIHGMNGGVADITDYCFRGVSSATPIYYLYQAKVYTPSGELADGGWAVDVLDSIREDIDFVEYQVVGDSPQILPELKKLVKEIPWIAELVTVVEEPHMTSFLVSGRTKGDHMFHVLSSLRNIATHHWESYKLYRETFPPREAFTLQMFSPIVKDWQGKILYNGYEYSQDYMWANLYTITKGAVKSVVENGPRWYLSENKLDYAELALTFKPSILNVDPTDPDSENWSNSTKCRLFRSFELPEDEDLDKTGFTSGKELIHYVEGLLK